MKILFDTNVLIAAFLNGGTCYEIIDDAVHHHTLCITDYILKEFQNVLTHKFHYSQSLVSEFTEFIQSHFSQGKTALHIVKLCRDSKDDPILADALENEIDVIVTGDKDLLELKMVNGMQIIHPQAYWNL